MFSSIDTFQINQTVLNLVYYRSWIPYDSRRLILTIKPIANMICLYLNKKQYSVCNLYKHFVGYLNVLRYIRWEGLVKWITNVYGYKKLWVLMALIIIMCNWLIALSHDFHMNRFESTLWTKCMLLYYSRIGFRYCIQDNKKKNGYWELVVTPNAVIYICNDQMRCMGVSSPRLINLTKKKIAIYIVFISSYLEKNPCFSSSVSLILGI